MTQLLLYVDKDKTKNIDDDFLTDFDKRIEEILKLLGDNYEKFKNLFEKKGGNLIIKDDIFAKFLYKDELPNVIFICYLRN